LAEQGDPGSNFARFFSARRCALNRMGLFGPRTSRKFSEIIFLLVFYFSFFGKIGAGSAIVSVLASLRADNR
jgi:hypothetical protein